MHPTTPFTALTHDDPTHLGGYRLLARLGSGGMGTVYLARSAGGRTVALKTVHARIATSADTTFRTRFRLESDAARIIGDRYGARVFGADPLGTTPWLATEYVLGPQLDEAVRLSGPLPEACVRALGADLARALTQLHRSDIVHRDLKPSNIMLTAAGPKLIDFGIARALGDERLTSTGTAAGTPAYMSPEQASGVEHTPPSDVFALASVLVFASSGHGPFGSGQPADLLYRVRYADPDLTNVPPPLLPLLTRCLSKDPSPRPSTAAVADLLASTPGVFADLLPLPLLADISRRTTAVWQDPPPRLPAPATEPSKPAPRSLSRRKLLAITGTAALATGGGLWTWLTTRDGGTPDHKPSLGQPPAQLWKKPLEDPGPDAAPLRVGNELVLLSRLTVSGLDPATGKDLWDGGYGKAPSSVATDGKTLYALRRPASDDKVKPLAIETVPQPSGKKSPPALTLVAFDGTPDATQLLCVEGNTAYLFAKSAADAQWFLVAANLKTGRELWRQQAMAPFERSPGPVITRGKLVKTGLLLCRRSALNDSVSFAVHDTATGKELWQTQGLPVIKEALPYQLATDENHVYFGSESLQALRLTDGTTAWSFGEGRDMGKKPNGYRRYGIPAVADGVVYTVEGGRSLVAVDARTGTALWSEPPVPDALPNGDVAPAVCGNLVLYMDKTGLRAVDTRTHQPLWRYPSTAHTLVADPAAKRLYAREDRLTFALRLP
ncbi:PQQ-binding-like beta-propeller repeat protein [Streptomyces sp. NPDC059874]|uniref:serine/threonine-protein kinase n=1 Tax=Streptomyces sp. NPDC059874 TaxID=3346983 RepID=UPI00364840F3